MTTIKFNTVSMRNNITIQQEGAEKIKLYTIIVKLKDLPTELEDWTNINPRDPKITSGVFKKIEQTLIEEPEKFLLRNRGLTVLANEVIYNQKTEEVTLILGDNDNSGLLDGGHSFKAILNQLRDNPEKEYNGFFKLEVITGITGDEISNLVGSRNTSTSLKEETLHNHQGEYEYIKEVLKNEKYFQNIAFYENELTDEEKPKTLDIKELLAYLTCFNALNYPDGNVSPVKAYSGKATVVKEFSTIVNDKTKSISLNSIIDLLPDIIILRDKIVSEIPDLWNLAGGKFGGISAAKSIRLDPTITKINDKFKGGYSVPDGFLYPILASMRANIILKDDKYTWKTDNLELWNKVKNQLISQLKDTSSSYQYDPQKTGKTNSVWTALYNTVLLYILSSKS
jgi:AIPR protein